MAVEFDNAPLTRSCGGCTLCCKLLPMDDDEPWRDGEPIHKKAGERCPHQRHNKGCVIYAKRPYCCKMWTCRWLVNDDTADLSRPDRARYVIDVMPDYITVRNDETGEQDHMQVVQIWVDPKHPEALRDPALRRYLQRRAAEGKAAVVRFNEKKAVVICAPALSSDDQWHEIPATGEGEHNFNDVVLALGGQVTMTAREKR